MDINTFCKRLPKVELHAHLNGSIRESTLVDLARERNVQLPTNFLAHESEHRDPDKEALFFNMKPRSLTECFAIFDVIPRCVNDLTALRRITKEVMEDAANDNVAYLEIRTGPKVLLVDHRSVEAEYCTKKVYIETIVSIMEEFEKTDRKRYEFDCDKANTQYIRLPLIPRLLISVDRSGTFDQAMENIQLAIEMSRSSEKKIIVGVELGGNPTRNNFRLFEPAFDIARKAGLPISIHCGEVPMAENELETDQALVKAYQEAVSVLQFKPDRLGHALLLSNSLMEKLFEHPIPIECCPTSNVMTLELALHAEGDLLHGVKLHPQLGKWIECGYPISINTDDSGLFCTNLTKEFLLVAKAYNVGEKGLASIVLNSVEHTFDSSGETLSMLRKEILGIILRERAANIETAIGPH
jgi:adenosine deaminase